MMIDEKSAIEIIKTKTIIEDEFGRDFANEFDAIELMLITINRLALRGEMNG